MCQNQQFSGGPPSLVIPDPLSTHFSLTPTPTNLLDGEQQPESITSENQSYNEAGYCCSDPGVDMQRRPPFTTPLVPQKRRYAPSDLIARENKNRRISEMSPPPPPPRYRKCRGQKFPLLHAPKFVSSKSWSWDPWRNMCIPKFTTASMPFTSKADSDESDSTTRPRVSPLSSNSTSTLQPPAHSHVDTEPLSNANSSLMFSHSFEQGRHQESPSPQASHDNMDLEAEVVHPKHDSPSTMPSGAFQVHDESNEPLFIAELQQDSSVSVVLGNKDNEEGTESFADGLQLLNSHLFQQAAPMPWTASLLSLNSDGFTNDISKRTNQRVRDKTSHAAEAMTKLNRLNLETRCLTLPEWTKIRSQITIADENEESVLFINGFHGVAPMRTPPRQSLLSPSIPDKAVGNLVTSLPAPKFDLAHECLFHYIKIHLLGLLGNTYFRLRTWKLLNVHNEKTQCTESLFIIENSTSNSLPNRMAAHVFFKSFKRFVSKGIYNSEIIGDLCSSSNVVLEAFHDELARYLHLYNASSKDPLCSTLLKKDRRDARRIAKWQSLCNVSEGSMVRVLGRCGAEICSSEESDDDQGCNPLPHAGKKRTRRWNKSWRARSFIDMLQGLRGRGIYCGKDEGEVSMGVMEKIPPQHTPIELIDEWYLERHGITHVGIQR